MLAEQYTLAGASGSRGRAFTLIELLVVIGVMGVLIALTLSAVMQVRSSANGAACRSNLRQIGLALHLYHDSQRSLPPGGRWSIGRTGCF